MFPEKYIRYGSIAVLSFIGLVVLIGCAQKIQPKAWLSVEKSPMRVIIVDSEKDITPETIHMVVDHVMNVDYKDYQFNDNTGISVHSNVNDQRHSSSTTILDAGGK